MITGRGVRGKGKTIGLYQLSLVFFYSFGYNRTILGTEACYKEEATERVWDAAKEDIMNCQTAESMVTRYIEHDLSVDELEGFIDHVENCPSCYEELETYFIVHAAMKQLDEESKDSTLNFQELLKEDIRRSKHYILKMKFRRALSGVGFCALIAGLGGFLIYVITQSF